MICLLLVLHSFAPQAFADCCASKKVAQVPSKEDDGWIEEDHNQNKEHFYQSPPDQNIQTVQKPITGTPEAVIVPAIVVLNILELAVFGKMNKKLAIIPRLELLEKNAFGEKADEQKNLDLDKRLNHLFDLFKPTEEQIANGHKGIKPVKNWFFIRLMFLG